MTAPYLAPKITLLTNPQGAYTFPYGPEWFSYPYAGSSYVGMKPPPPLFGTNPRSGPAESHFRSLYDGIDHKPNLALLIAFGAICLILMQ